jgi:membrane-associated phospholipid phosphatase
MHSLDQAIISFCNQFAQRWPIFDQIVVFLSNSDLVKGGVLLAALWLAWFRSAANVRLNRAYLLSSLFGSVVSLTIARVLAHVLPLRVRPILDPTLHFRAPAGVPDQANWTIWSSFPSDHGALFFALLTGVWLAYPRAGLILLFYVVTVIVFPRIYIGIHYPSDLVAGAALGIMFVLLCSWGKIRQLWTGYILDGVERWPGPAYALLFLATFQIATLFWDLRTFLFIFNVSV